MQLVQALRRRLDLLARDFGKAKLLLTPAAERFYSQHGEDRVLKALFPENHGFYVDIGAYDPHHYSNTAHFYGIGWSGINIEPSPTQYAQFPRKRPRDLNLNIGISGSGGTLNFYKMDPDTLSTFSEKTARAYAEFEHHRIAEVIPVPVLPLSQVFEKHLGGREIQFMSVDTEGLEKEVLGSNDWARFRPAAILIEYREYHPSGTTSTSAAQWEPMLLKAGYRLAYLNFLNAIYVREESKDLLARLAGRKGTGYANIEAALPHVKLGD